MELLKSLLHLFDSEGLQELRRMCAADKSLHHKLITYLIDHPSAGDEEVIAALRTSRNTYHKTGSIAKDIIWEKYKEKVSNPFDDVFALQHLLLKGELDMASRIFASLEKEMEEKQAWQLLDTLYIEGFRLCQITGDLKKMETLVTRRKSNAARLARYIEVFSDTMPEMIRLEGFKSRKSDVSKQMLVLKQLYQRSVETGHHVLIHNTLHLQYLFHVRYTDKPAAVHRIVQDMLANASKHRKAMNVLTQVAVQTNHVNFLTMFADYGEPAQPVKKLQKNIHAAGKWMVANLGYAMLEYSLYAGKQDELRYWLRELEKVEDNSKFAQYRYIIQAIKSFTEKNYNGFRKNFNKFYSDPSHLDFPDMEVTLRLLEIILLAREKELKLAEPRISSLRVYMDRNLNAERYAQERQLLIALGRLVLKNNKTLLETAINASRKSAYRSIRFLGEQAAMLLRS